MGDRCNPCGGTGFVNIDQLPDNVRHEAELSGDFCASVMDWIESTSEPHDIRVCDCCGNGEDHWHDSPGEHDPRTYGQANGPYQYNGGVPECH